MAENISSNIKQLTGWPEFDSQLRHFILRPHIHSGPGATQRITTDLYPGIMWPEPARLSVSHAVPAGK